MKTLHNHTIVYDQECPMCQWYTQAFVSSGMLDSDGRVAYKEAVNKLPIDWDRARNEIALVNTKDQTVTYGVESLTTILGNRWPVFIPLFRFKPFAFLIQQLYFFISYNRKVIAPGASFESKDACTPDFHRGYRWAYILFAWLVTSLVLVYSFRLGSPLIPQSHFYREFLICGGQILFQGTIVAMIHRRRLLHYLGNLMTVSLGGALLLLPMFLLTGVIKTPFFYAGYFLVVVAGMFLEHKRRVRLLELPAYVSWTWVLYRLIILTIIL